jgi:ferredoxin-nitrite reductase
MLAEMGIEKMKELLAEEFGKCFTSAGALKLQHHDFKEFHQLKDGKYGYCYQSNFGKLDADEMLQIAEFAEKNGADIRIGIDQNIYILGIDKQEVPFSSPALSSTIVACAGNLCPYAVWSIKDEAGEFLPLEAIYKNRIKVGFSGCAKGCGRHRHTDIGLIGLKTNNFGDTDGGARVFIGAQHDTGASVARQLFSMVPFVHLKKTLTLVIRLFEKSGYENFQLYSHYVLNHYSEDFLSLWHLYNLKENKEISLQKEPKALSQEDETALLREHFTDVVLIENNMKKSVSQLVKELWTVEGQDPHYKPPIERTTFR